MRGGAIRGVAARRRDLDPSGAMMRLEHMR